MIETTASELRLPEEARARRTAVTRVGGGVSGQPGAILAALPRVGRLQCHEVRFIVNSALFGCGRFLLAVLLCSISAIAAGPERVIIFSNSSRDLADFRAFAKTACRMKRYGRVQIDIGVLAGKATFELPPGGNEWHQYAVFNASLSKFFPHPKIAPFRPPEWVAKNRELLLAKAATLREYGLEAALSSNDTHYLPEAFFERYPHLRGPRVDHPRRSRREEFSFCVDLDETRGMIEWMTAEAKRNIPELKTILVHTNDSGTGLCWADWQYSGPNGPQHCRRRGTGLRVHDLAEAMHRGAVKGGGEIDIRIGGMFSERELDDIARQLPPHVPVWPRSAAGRWPRHQ